MIVMLDRQHYGAEHRYTRESGFPQWTLELTTSGTMTRRSGGEKRFRVQPNHALILTPPGVPYALRAAAAGDEWWAIFTPRPAYEPLLAWPEAGGGVRMLRLPNSPAARQILAACLELYEVTAARVELGGLIAENGFERLLLLAHQVQVEATAATGDERIRASLAYLESAREQALTVAHLAARAGLSASRYAHLFHAETGRTPREYLEQLRLERAQQLLLRTNLPVKVVASQVGFDDPFYFSTRFRHRLGQSPTAWRKRPGTSGRGDGDDGEL